MSFISRELYLYVIKRVLVVAGIAVSWSASTQLAQAAEVSNTGSSAPFTFTTWIITSWNVILYIAAYFLRKRSANYGYDKTSNQIDTTETSSIPTNFSQYIWTAAVNIHDTSPQSLIHTPLISIDSIAGTIEKNTSESSSWTPNPESVKTPFSMDPSNKESPSGHIEYDSFHSSIMELPTETTNTLGLSKSNKWYSSFKGFIAKLEAENLEVYWNTKPIHRWAMTIFPFFVLWTATYLCYTASIEVAPATISSAMFATTPGWVFCISWIFGKLSGFRELRKSVLWLYGISSLLAIIGVVLVLSPWELTQNDVQKDNLLWIGTVLGIAAAIAASVYKVIYPLLVGSADIGQVMWTLASVGVINIVFGWVMWVAPWLLGAYPQFSIADLDWTALSTSAICGVVSNVLINFGVVYVGPVFVAIGSAFGIPLNAIVDTLIHDKAFTKWEILGFCTVFIGFVLSTFATSKAHRDKRR